MITLAEKFVATQIEKGSRAATFLAGETLLISLIGYALIRWDAFMILILNHPWLILLTFIVNFTLGKWSGLRITEYIRFRKVIAHL